MNKTIPFLLLFLFVQSHAQEDYLTEETVVATSCSLSVKTTVYTADPGDVVGKASIEATLCDKAGTPIPDQTINVTATTGIFTCIPPDGINRINTSDRSCFVTGPDGKIQVFLVDIPFNKPGRIKATCNYGDFTVHASGSYSLSRSITRKKSIKKNTPSASTTD